jgi:quercetin dioxygenase-like cupin family protein
MRIRPLVLGTAILALSAPALVGSTAVATPGSGTTVGPPPPFDARLAPVKAKADGITLKTKDETVVRSFTLTYAPNAYSGWHRHPGIVIAVVTEGAVYRKLPCQKREKFVAGQAFTEVGTHFVRNVDRRTTGGVPAKLLITQIVPADTKLDEFRQDEDKPRCGRR